MSAFYTQMGQVVSSLLSQFGTAATLTTITRNFNKTTNRMEAESRTSTPCLAVVRPIEVQDDEGQLLKVTQAVLNVEPKEGGVLTMGSTIWTIGKVTVVKPIGTPIVYMAEVV